GLAYSVYSYFLPMRAAGPFMAGLQTRRDQTGEALALLRKTLEDYVEQGPTEAELRASKRNVTGGFPLRIASNGDLADYLAMIGFYGLPLDYLDRFNERIEAVTAAQIRDAFRRRIHPERMVTVIVGGP
ncbi:MAG TPA: insulinase family protein, partial [Chromatiales bacterium]|nr:insulinase family protein [Chromatiales bacterium]